MTFTIAQNVRGANREFIMNGERFLIEYVSRPIDLPPEHGWDSWRYTLPNGEHYSHPTQFGALLMCLKHLGGGQWENA